MKKVYTCFQRAFVLFLSLGLLSTAAFGQVCGSTVTENFNNTGGTTAGFTGDFSYDAAGQRLIRRNVIATALYTITTPTWKLATGATTLGYGFVLSGTERVSRVEAVITYVSTLTGQLTSFFLEQLVPNYGVGTTATICRGVDIAELPGFPPSGQYRLRFEIVSSTGNGQLAQTITFDDFRTTGALSPSPLPVVFIGFDAKKTPAGAQLAWKVAGEENVNHYEVERSSDGRSFVSIGSVVTSRKDNYSYLDADGGATAYYRIKNVDNDGKFKYSTIVRIANGKSSILIKAFPQPVTTQLTVQHPVVKGNGLLTVSTAEGRVVNVTKLNAGSMQTFIDASKLQKGMYIVRFDDGEGNTETMKVIKQ